ncbi:MAG: hypothetical protein ABIJ47_01395 [Candidatus Bathyarchaeota archaeon]
MSKRTRQRRSRPRRDKGAGIGAPSRSRSQSFWDDVGERINVSYDVLGHPYHRTKPVEEDKHYTVLAYTDWADTFVPTVIKWSHGEVDDFTNPGKSLLNRSRAIQHTKSSSMSQSIKLPVGGGTLKVGGKEYIWRTGDRSYEAAQEKAEDLRKQGHKAVIRKEKVAGKPTYVVYARKEGA